MICLLSDTCKRQSSLRYMPWQRSIDAFAFDFRKTDKEEELTVAPVNFLSTEERTAGFHKEIHCKSERGQWRTVAERPTTYFQLPSERPRQPH